MRSSLLLSLIALASLLATGVASAAPVVVDASFDDAANPDGYGPVVGWTQSPFPSGNPGFAGGYLTGANSAGGVFWDNGTVPGEGVTGKVAAIQAYAPFGNTVMSLEQSVSGFVAGQSYVLSYYENSRAGTTAPTMEVFVGGQSVVAQHSDPAVEPGGTFSTPFRLVNSIPFTVPSSTALVEFRVTTTGDSSATIDNVAINPVPEPSTVALLGLGAIGLLAFGRRRRAA